MRAATATLLKNISTRRPRFLERKVLGIIVELVVCTAHIEASGQTSLTDLHPHTFDRLHYGQMVSSDRQLCPIWFCLW